MSDENRKPPVVIIDIEDRQALRELLQHLANELAEDGIPNTEPLPEGAGHHRPTVACIDGGLPQGVVLLSLSEGASHHRPIVACVDGTGRQGVALISGIGGIGPIDPHRHRHHEPLPLVMIDEEFSSSDPHEILAHLRENFCESARLEHSRLFSRLLEEVQERLQISSFPTVLPIMLQGLEAPPAFGPGLGNEKKKLSRQMRQWRRERR